MRDPVVVLKFGSSVLPDETALPAVLLEIYRRCGPAAAWSP